MSKCNKCAGKKTIKGMGMMTISCPDCKGSGLEAKPKIACVVNDSPPLESITPKVIEKKKGSNEYGK